jgi:hypothetical protein
LGLSSLLFKNSLQISLFFRLFKIKIQVKNRNKGHFWLQSHKDSMNISIKPYRSPRERGISDLSLENLVSISYLGGGHQLSAIMMEGLFFI